MSEAVNDYYSPESRHQRMVAAQRNGFGLTLGTDGNWHADHLEGDERAQVELLVNAEMATTHHACEMGGAYVEATGVVQGYVCPLCGTGSAINARGMVMPHTIRITPEVI